ncbi:glycosyl hydrolase family 18 protein [Paucisalibacillus sp. EB02]|uniref:glycosyl hydrolase family 18 protein n=1 Tax=Paucisalibacillus sp. EB02 TaxID=1347087 RepID=UPI0004B68C0F|nr:glycosyl hydrolase family 18 protein [Paucisalibacillus sp. EB02]
MFFRRRQRIMVLAVAFIVLTACTNTNNKTEQPTVVETAKVDIGTSLWLVDWASEKGIEEATEALKDIDNILLFATYFDEIGRLYQVEDSRQLIDDVVGNPHFDGSNVYITIVNDLFKDDGSIIQKDPEILKDILHSPSTREDHVDEIIEFVEDYPIEGIEIDYENIPAGLEDEFILFAQELQVALEEVSLYLRIILEPGFPVESYPLPEKLQFVVMAYNLYGYHSGPGPKADYVFLDSLMKRFPNHAGNIDIALSTGGFSWQDGHVESMTYEQISEVIRHFHIEPIRHEESGALSFIYQEEGQDVEVWYADATTLKLWTEKLVSNGYKDISIWRAGGLNKEVLNIFGVLKEPNMGKN